MKQGIINFSRSTALTNSETSRVFNEYPFALDRDRQVSLVSIYMLKIGNFFVCYVP